MKEYAKQKQLELLRVPLRDFAPSRFPSRRLPTIEGAVNANKVQVFRALFQTFNLSLFCLVLQITIIDFRDDRMPYVSAFSIRIGPNRHSI